MLATYSLAASVDSHCFHKQDERPRLTARSAILLAFPAYFASSFSALFCSFLYAWCVSFHSHFPHFNMRFLIAAFVLVAATVVHGQDNSNCDVSNYNGFNPITDAQHCVTYSGSPGIFDQDGDSVPVTNSSVCVCSDRLNGVVSQTAKRFCLFDEEHPQASSTNVMCTGDDSENDNKITTSCIQGYLPKAPCYPMNANDPTGEGKCQNTKRPFAQAKTAFHKLPCQYFNTTIPTGESRFYCIGDQGDHLLQCPGNKISKCQNGCVGKFEWDNSGNPDMNKPCGKAACAGAPAAPGYQT